MSFHQYDFDEVEGYLHHRDPYLLIQRIVSIADPTLIAESTFSGSEFFLQGHFPGAPIVPGAIMQELTTQAAGILIAARYNPLETYDTSDPSTNQQALGVLTRVRDAKYRSFARPGDRLQIVVQLTDHLDHLFEFRGQILVDEVAIMTNRFQLANIESQRLVGARASRNG